jgi:hypothetical protein
LTEKLSLSHSGVERSDDDRAEVRRGRLKQPSLLGNAHHSPRDAPLANERHPRQRVRGEESFIHRPIQNVAEALQVAVHRRVGNLLLRVAVGDSFAARLLKLIESCGSWVLSQPQNHLHSGNEASHGHFAFECFFSVPF